MKGKLCSRVAVVLCGAALCASTYGEVFLDEHAGYRKGPDGGYDVWWDEDMPYIEILQPSNSLLGPYHFECYDGSPGNPATIGAITLDGDLTTGNVEIMVCSEDGSTYGASDVDILVLVQTGVTSTIQQFTISGDLGDDGVTLVEVGNINDSFEAVSIVSDMDVDRVMPDTEMSVLTVAEDVTLFIYDLDGTLCLTGDGPHLGNIETGTLEDPAAIVIAGTMEGSITIDPTM